MLILPIISTRPISLSFFLPPPSARQSISSTGPPVVVPGTFTDSLRRYRGSFPTSLEKQFPIPGSEEGLDPPICIVPGQRRGCQIRNYRILVVLEERHIINQRERSKRPTVSCKPAVHHPPLRERTAKALVLWESLRLSQCLLP